MGLPRYGTDPKFRPYPADLPCACRSGDCDDHSVAWRSDPLHGHQLYGGNRNARFFLPRIIPTGYSLAGPDGAGCYLVHTRGIALVSFTLVDKPIYDVEYSRRRLGLGP